MSLTERQSADLARALETNTTLRDENDTLLLSKLAAEQAADAAAADARDVRERYEEQARASSAALGRADDERRHTQRQLHALHSEAATAREAASQLRRRVRAPLEAAAERMRQDTRQVGPRRLFTLLWRLTLRPPLPLGA